MRRWALILAGGAVWLFLLALTAFADGGPHVASVNNGSAGVSSDNCAGCHRAHTAQAEYLLKHEVPDLCMSCHGTAGIGASTNVEDGVQYVPAGDGSRTGTVLGALRAGGFVNARIASGSAARLAYAAGSSVRQHAKVPVAATGQAVTSTHMDVDSLAEATVWGNGALGSAGAGGTTTLNCTSCHNPHGNGNYRILNPRPAGNGGTAIVASADVLVPDGALGTPDGTGRYPTRNYTVIQIQGTEGTDSSYLLYADQVVAGAYADTAGDYFHRRVPWNSSSGSNDAPNGKPSTFNAQINLWCSQCHTRYLAITGAPYMEDSGDAIFKYRHSNTSNKPCTTCHVAHGSNAQMTGFNSTHQYYPGEGDDPSATENTSSRLLKIDNRGTCQACHDPTGTIVAGTLVGPTPVPYLP